MAMLPRGCTLQGADLERPGRSLSEVEEHFEELLYLLSSICVVL